MLGASLTINLVSCSLVDVEYHELSQIALARSKLTGRVERRVTIYPGCHLLFPDTELIRFKGTAHNLLSDLEVSSSEGVVLRLKLSLQYFIKAEELGDLHKNYDETYEAVVRRVIESEVKNAAVHFSLDDYRLHRATVEQHIYRQLASRLEGNCCSPCCPKHCSVGSQYAGHNCSTCSTSPGCQPGLHVSLLAEQLQLGAVELPQEVTERYLRLVLLQVETQKESFLEVSKVERKLTEQQTLDILNQANEVRSAAMAEARRRGLRAKVIADVLKDTAYIQAMEQLFLDLNITIMEHRLSLMLMLAFRDVGQQLHLQHKQLSVMGQETVV